MPARQSIAAAAVLLVCLFASPGSAQDKGKAPAPPAWVYPQDVQCAGRRLTLHEPQVVAWDGREFKMSLRFAAPVTDPLGRSSFGMLEVSGAVHLDLRSRLVKVVALEAGRSAFPAMAANDATAVQAGLQDALPKS